MQKHPFVHAGNYITGDPHSNQDCLTAFDAIHHFLIRRVYGDA
jgi:hypothetical protein